MASFFAIVRPSYSYTSKNDYSDSRLISLKPVTELLIDLALFSDQWIIHLNMNETGIMLAAKQLVFKPIALPCL